MPTGARILRVDNTTDSRLTNLENNVYKITYYEIVSGASGTITPPTGATFNANEFGGSGDSILSKINVDNKPTFSSPTTAGGVVVTANLNPLTGAWTASGIYTDTSVALIYSINISAADYSNLNNFYIIEETKLGFTLPSLTNGSVLFSNGTTIAEDNSNFFYNDTNNRLGLGTPTPSTTLHLNVPSAADVLSITKTDDVYTYIKGSLLGGAAGFYFGNGSGGVTNMISYSNKMLLTQPLHLSSSYSATNTGSWLTISQAPTASANYGLVSLGSGPFDGTTSGYFSGSASGTVLAVNTVSGFTGNHIHIQKGGVSEFAVMSGSYNTVVLGNISGFNGNTPSETKQFRVGINSVVDGYEGRIYLSSYSGTGPGLYVDGTSGSVGSIGIYPPGGSKNYYQHVISPQANVTATTGAVGLTSIQGTFAAGAGNATFRPLNIAYTINNSGAQTGVATGIFLNATETALNGITHNLMDLQVGGVNKFKVSNTGLISTPIGIDADATSGGNGYVSAGYAGGLLLNGGVLTINRAYSPNRVNYASGYSGGHSFTGSGTTTILGVGGAAISALSVTVAPTSSSNYGLLSLGNGAFDGSTSGYFTGSANGTLIAGNLASGSTSDLMNLQVAGIKQFGVTNSGAAYFNGTVQFGTSGFGNTAASSTGFNNGYISWHTSGYFINFTNNFGYEFLGYGGSNASSGNYYGFAVRNQTIAQSGTAGYTDFLVNRATQSSVGSGSQLLADFQVGGVSKFKVDNDGGVTVNKYYVSAMNTAPSSASDTGTLGEIRVTAIYIYVCTATNTWVRTALTTW